MDHPFIHGLKEAFPHARQLKNRPFVGGLRLKSATGCEYWVDDAFKLSYEYHDAPEAFVAILEFRAAAPLTFPMHCPYFDLHGVYVDEGGLTIRKEDNSQKAPFILQPESYAFIYAAKDDYLVELPDGTTLIYLWAFKKSWPKRYITAPQFKAISTLLYLLDEQPAICHSSRMLPLHPTVREQWKLLAKLPQLRPMSMDTGIYDHLIELIYLGIETLQESRKDRNDSLKTIMELRAVIIKHVKAGISPRVDALAEERRTSESYLVRMHKKLYGTSIKAFITKVRMKRAHDLLEKGNMTITEVAYAVGYTSLRDFDLQFLAYFGYTPGEVKKK
ncbi:AraC-type DNA-binding protein [bacterium A37T11]|nr:AraC-type DNA-binding protein [bacterium A37T11]